MTTKVFLLLILLLSLTHADLEPDYTLEMNGVSAPTSIDKLLLFYNNKHPNINLLEKEILYALEFEIHQCQKTKDKLYFEKICKMHKDKIFVKGSTLKFYNDCKNVVIAVGLDEQPIDKVISPEDYRKVRFVPVRFTFFNIEGDSVFKVITDH